MNQLTVVSDFKTFSIIYNLALKQISFTGGETMLQSWDA